MKKDKVIILSSLALILAIMPFVAFGREERDCGIYNCSFLDRVFSDDPFFHDHFFNTPRDHKGPMERRERMFFSSKVKVDQNEKEYKFFYELPGIEEDKIKVEYSNRILTIKTNERNEKVKDRKNKEEYSSFSANFRNSIRLPEDADENTIAANYKNGLLTVTIKKDPKLAKKEIKIIEINKTNKPKKK